MDHLLLPFRQIKLLYFFLPFIKAHYFPLPSRVSNSLYQVFWMPQDTCLSHGEYHDNVEIEQASSPSATYFNDFSRPDTRETCILAAISEGKLSPMPVLHEVSVSYCSINLECLVVTCSKVALSRSLAIISMLSPVQVF